MDTPTIFVTSYGHPLDSSVTRCGHPPRVSVPLIARIFKKKLRMRTKTIFFTIFTMLIVYCVFLRHIRQDESSCNSPFKEDDKGRQRGRS